VRSTTFLTLSTYETISRSSKKTNAEATASQQREMTTKMTPGYFGFADVLMFLKLKLWSPRTWKGRKNLFNTEMSSILLKFSFEVWLKWSTDISLKALKLKARNSVDEQVLLIDMEASIIQMTAKIHVKVTTQAKQR
jgi:hypothetical protein